MRLWSSSGARHRKGKRGSWLGRGRGACGGAHHRPLDQLSGGGRSPKIHEVLFFCVGAEEEENGSAERRFGSVSSFY